MGRISILAPRWRDRVVLVATWKISPENTIDITHVNKSGERTYPRPFHITAKELAKYPSTQINGKPMIAVPLDDLLKEYSNE